MQGRSGSNPSLIQHWQQLRLQFLESTMHPGIRSAVSAALASSATAYFPSSYVYLLAETLSGPGSLCWISHFVEATASSSAAFDQTHAALSDNESMLMVQTCKRIRKRGVSITGYQSLLRDQQGAASRAPGFPWGCNHQCAWCPGVVFLRARLPDRPGPCTSTHGSLHSSQL